MCNVVTQPILRWYVTYNETCRFKHDHQGDNASNVFISKCGKSFKRTKSNTKQEENFKYFR